MAHVMTLLSAGGTLAGKRGLFPADDPLTAAFLAKAQGLTLNVKAHRIWSGPDQPSRQTAEAAGLSSVIEPALRDLDYGRWSSRPIRDIAEAEPDRFHRWLGGAAAPDGTGLDELHARIDQWLGEQCHDRGHTLAVVSPNVVRACLLVALAVPITAFHRLDVLPLTLTRLTCEGRHWRMRAMGLSAVRRDPGDEQADDL